MMKLTFRSLCEADPGPVWGRIFDHGWAGWRAWHLARGGDRTPRLREAERALHRHMPEMVPVWERLVTVAGDDELTARFLSFWSPPRYLTGCSQAVLVDDDGPMLIRNYDLDPVLNESTAFKSAWKGRRVMGMVEGMAGLADGMNESGLAASLTFGGRAVVGRGFGIPWILRYVLEICCDTREAVEVLRAVPCHMSYNVTVVDRGGDLATVYLAPDRPPIVTRKPSTTNHQLGVELARHGRLSKTIERADHLDRLLADPDLSRGDLVGAFLTAPLFNRAYSAGFGTVYTSVYRPCEGTMGLYWPGRREWRLGFDGFRQGRRGVRYDESAPEEQIRRLMDRIAENLKRPDSADWTLLASHCRPSVAEPDIRRRRSNHRDMR